MESGEISPFDRPSSSSESSSTESSPTELSHPLLPSLVSNGPALDQRNGNRISNSNQDDLGLHSSGPEMTTGLDSGPLNSHWRWFIRLRLNSRKLVWAVWNGPKHIRDEPPKPIRWLYSIEMLPTKLRFLMSKPYRVLLLTLYMLVWVYTWDRAMMPYYTSPPRADGVPVVSLTCGQVGDFWKGKNAACGLDSRFCPTFAQDLEVIFRCPALCDRGSWLYSLRVVGDEILKYRGFYIGGGHSENDKDHSVLSHPYRADSFPCGAAVHAGVVSPFFGGCAKTSYVSGAQSSFPPTAGRYGVSDSIGFDSFFPKSYVFMSLPELFGPCKDPRVLIMIFNVFMGIPVVFLASSSTFYWIMSVVGFWTISLATDPPVLVDPQDPETLYDLISVSLERFLPTCFILYVLWVISVKRTFHLENMAEEHASHDDPERLEPTIVKNVPVSSPLHRVIFWYLFFWLGVLNNVTFDRLPIDRLTPHDLKSMPGALLAMCILGGVTFICIGAQGYYLWLLGRLWKFFKVYALVSCILVILALLPGLTLRIHHYIFALLLIPGCSTRGWTAYVFQGLLLGLFLSGVARWGYASIAETNFSLLRGEPLGQIIAPLVEKYESGVLYWRRPDGSSYDTALDGVDQYTEVSLLINDIERYRGVDHGNVNVTDIIETNEYLKRLVDMAMENSGDVGEISMYLRLARYSNKQRKYGDYTKTSIFKYPSLEWTPAPLGVT